MSKRTTGDLSHPPLPPGLRAFLFGSVGATILALVAGLLRLYLHGRPFGSDGLWPPSWGYDFNCYYARYVERHSVRFFTTPVLPWYYPAPAIFVYAPFYGITHRLGGDLTKGLLVYTWAVVAEGVALSLLLGWALHRAGLRRGPAALFSVLTLLSAWPLYFAAQRGNIEAFGWLLTGIGVLAIARNRPSWAAVFFGIAGSIKLYPLLFGALLLRPRRWPWLGIMALSFTVTTLLALYYLEPNLRDGMQRVSDGVHQFTGIYGQIYRSPEWDHSSFALFKDITHARMTSYKEAIHTYYKVAACCALLLYVWRIRRMPIANQVLFLSCAAVVLPPTSFEYTLLLLYIPVVWLTLFAVRSALQGRSVRGLTFTLFSLGLAVAPTTYSNSAAIPQFSGGLKAVLLLTCLALACIFPFAELEADTPNTLQQAKSF